MSATSTNNTATANYAYVAVWNMNGGPVPPDALKALTEAVEAVLKASEDKNGTRLLYNIISNDSEESV